ncbi:MAG: N-methyl-D-aspartate receptor NMDAR2C subunit [Gemmatimonadales bacterium]
MSRAPPGQSLQARFERLWRRLGAAGDGAALFAELDAAYREPARVYHTTEHLADCLARLDEFPEPEAERDLVEAAIWFHDAVYDPRRSDNESRSAEWAARAFAETGVAGNLVERIRRLVLLTRHLGPAPDPAGQLLCDIDLSILGREPAEFERFERAIRAEYAWVPEPEYRTGRARILRGFLQREPLYQTVPFRLRYEDAARRNLAGALARLAEPPQTALG